MAFGDSGSREKPALRGFFLDREQAIIRQRLNWRSVALMRKLRHLLYRLIGDRVQDQ